MSRTIDIPLRFKHVQVVKEGRHHSVVTHGTGSVVGWRLQKSMPMPESVSSTLPAVKLSQAKAMAVAVVWDNYLERQSSM